MSISSSINIAYGYTVDIDIEAAWDAYEDPQYNGAEGSVLLANVGAYDQPDHALVIRTSYKEVEPGDTQRVHAYRPTDDPYPDWDALLVEAAEKLNARPHGQPAWLFIHSQG